MKIARYELKVVYKKELILMMEDDVDSEDLLKIFLETQLKEEKEQSELLGIIAEKVSEESCTEQLQLSGVNFIYPVISAVVLSGRP